MIVYSTSPNLYIRKFEGDDKGRNILTYLVTLNGEDQAYMYDGKRYQDEADQEKTNEENERINALIEAGAGDEVYETRVHHVHRVEYIIFVNENTLDISSLIACL